MIDTNSRYKHSQLQPQTDFGDMDLFGARPISDGAAAFTEEVAAANLNDTLGQATSCCMVWPAATVSQLCVMAP